MGGDSQYGDLSIILKQELRRLQECNARIVICQTMQKISTTHLNKHIRAHTIGTESNQYILLEKIKQGSDANCVVHI